MPRQSAVAVENNFRNGLVTEATGINFPENGCTETFDCVFNFDGSVQRRLGFDFELDFTTKNITRSNKVIKEHVWKNVSGDGDVTLLVKQVGDTLYFYKTTEGAISQGAIADTIVMAEVSGAPMMDTVEAQFCDGNGYLFVTHPYIEPFRVAYDTSSEQVTPTDIIIKIRDFEGAAADSLGITDRPTATLASMTDVHEYNLRNQGWTTESLTAWDTAQTTMPSNADQMWRFKDASENLDFSNASIARITLGNTLAPKGHYILTLSNQDRDAAAGTTGVAATTTGYQRPSTCAFSTGRVFYTGVNKAKFNSKIFFTQIAERDEQYAYCYQVNDPTAEELFDLLPSDGGVIDVQEAGTIHKLFPVPGGIAVFAANGIWYITGSQGIGFTANDYTVIKIASIETLGASTFVDVAGFPAWWNAEGIYVMSAQGNLPTVKSLSQEKIKSFYDTIPLSSKRRAKGYYNSTDGIVQWIYRSTATQNVDDIYSYDRCLNLDTNTGAFYPWRITDSDVHVHGIFVSDAIGGQITINNVVDGSGNLVIDSGGNQVVVFRSTGSDASPAFKYICSYPDPGSGDNFTFAEASNEDYIDWLQYDATGEDFDSYFISGFKLRGEGLRKFQSNWTTIFSRIGQPVSYTFQGIWDWALTGSGTGRWSPTQLVQHTDLNYSTARRRLKVRGHGLALQFHVKSVSGEPFDIVGWSSLDSANALP